MAKRQTVKIDFLRDYANHLLAQEDRDMQDGSPCVNATWRHGVCAMIEKALFESGNYRGFNYNETYVEGVTDVTRRHYH